MVQVNIDHKSGRARGISPHATCERHRVSAAAGHPDHRLLDALHQLGDSVSGQLVGAQTQFTTVTLTKCVQSSAH